MACPPQTQSTQSVADLHSVAAASSAQINLTVAASAHDFVDQALVLPVMSPDIALLLYSLLGALHQLLTGPHLQTPITYWLSGGTLLGLTRHAGLIPSDTTHQHTRHPTLLAWSHLVFVCLIFLLFFV